MKLTKHKLTKDIKHKVVYKKKEINQDVIKLPVDVAQLLIFELAKLGIIAHVRSIATSGSVYIKFEQKDIGRLRIATHIEGRCKGRRRNRWGYRWNLRADVITQYTDSIEGNTRFFFPMMNYREVAKCIYKYHINNQLLKAINGGVL